MKEIEKIEERFGLLDHVPVGMCLLREDLVVLYWNRCLEGWTRIPRRNIVGTKIGDYFSLLKESMYTDRLRSIFNGGPATIFSSQLHRNMMPSRLKRGDIRIQHTTIISVPVLEGAGFYALLVVQDVTELTHRIQQNKLLNYQLIQEREQQKQVKTEMQIPHEKQGFATEEATGIVSTANEKSGNYTGK